jgi:predicted MFS family arabinose efflux permease
MGLISAGHSIGAALGAFMGGYLFDATKGYEWLWSSSFGLALLAAAIAFLIPARNRGEYAMA